MAEKNAMMVSSHDVVCDKKYTEWLRDIKSRYRQSQIKAAIKVNSEKLLFNWQLGRDLVMRKAEERWGSGIVEQVSLDLQREFPGEGFSTTNIWYMKKWYLFYSEKLNQVGKELGEQKLKQLAAEFDHKKLDQFGREILQQPAGELSDAGNQDVTKLQQVAGEIQEGIEFPVIFGFVPWFHHVEIITKCKTLDEAIFYIRKTIAESWSRNTLIHQIKADLYGKHGKAVTNFSEWLPEEQAVLAQEMTKDNYDFGFITLPQEYEEKDLENALCEQITRFLLELGNGFSFVGRQKEIVVDGVSRRIDMLFYHLRLHCYVVVELKACRFQPEFAGKLNFYVNAVDDLLKTDIDRPTIGLLICSDMRQTEVKYSFQGLNTPIGVAKYSNVQIAEIMQQLPSEKMLQERIEMVKQQNNNRYCNENRTTDDTNS